MRFLNIGVAIVILSFAANSFAGIPAMTKGNRYGGGQTIASTKTTKHVQENREFHNGKTGETHRRVLIYGQNGKFQGYAKTGRTKGDATTRHYHNK